MVRESRFAWDPDMGMPPDLERRDWECEGVDLHDVEPDVGKRQKRKRPRRTQRPSNDKD